jgi:hypothetical protein
LEAGGALCGSGSGKKTAEAVLKNINTFLTKGGRLSFLALESIFSRTHAGCKGQTVDQTATEVAGFAAGLATKLFGAKFFLYDALPHYNVDKWPANQPQYKLDLKEVLTALAKVIFRSSLSFLFTCM